MQFSCHSDAAMSLHDFNSLFVRDACDEGNDIALVDDLVVAFMF